MIIVRTPLRISFLGGGTDIRDYYKTGYGCVVGMAIDKYVNVILNKRFERSIRISYRENEIVDDIKDIRHGIIREALNMAHVRSNLEIVTVADVPGTGTGLGSSSSLTVGLCNALSLFNKKQLGKKRLAELACEIEIKKLHSPIGKQDQYFASHGGILCIRFKKDEEVKVEPLRLAKSTKKELEYNTLAFFTGLSRKTNRILTSQVRRLHLNLPILDKMRDLAEAGRDHLKNDHLNEFAILLDKGWKLKKQLSSNVSSHYLDSLYNKGIRAGAIGGKIAGSGCGGFIIFYCEHRYQKKLRDSMRGLEELYIKTDDHGTKKMI